MQSPLPLIWNTSSQLEEIHYATTITLLSSLLLAPYSPRYPPVYSVLFHKFSNSEYFTQLEFAIYSLV